MRKRSLIAAAGMAIFLSQAAAATTLITQTLPQLVEEADGIVAGEVVDLVSRKSQDGTIYTYATLGNLDLIKGKYGGTTLTLRLEGGTADGETLFISGSPRFQKSERVVVLVRGNGEQIIPVVGWEQGLFRVKSDPDTGRETVSEAVGNRIFGISDGKIVKEQKNKPEAEYLNLDDQRNEASPSPQGSGGRTESGQEVPLSPSGSSSAANSIQLGAAATGQTMDYRSFVEQLRNMAPSSTQNRVAGAAEARGLVSVDPSEVVVRGNTDALPPSVEAPSQDLRQGPAAQPNEAAPQGQGTEGRRGELPRPLEAPQRSTVDPR